MFTVRWPIRSMPSVCRRRQGGKHAGWDWRAAEDGWFGFHREHSLQPGWAAAYRMKARALEDRGERAAARAIWENLGTGLLDNKYAPLSDLEKTACFIRAAQLKK